ncbi:hypothetical protein E6Q11_02725 [Candidatus Dojkabacteria bacterium]|uniref:HTH domain-containing protein n=1 Tax=Candidatus Dojkabacteria bacterium TaxID=2099670 RepID=A0A5C7J7E8_9BACT|nr:MAG: hypothetical protein E6Q11_02725 [Candidatus Dojkabacteria bacterium]
MRKYLTIESSTHVLIALFTLTSWANIRAFLIDAGHDPVAAALLSGALGAALAVISLALTKIDLATERPTFNALVTVGAGLALLSGALQASEYSRHLSTVWAVALGFGTPVLGEIGLSLASSLFSKAQRRSELRAVNARIEAAIVGNLDQAIASFDPSTIQKRIDKTLNRVALAAVGGVESNLMAVYGEVLPDREKDEGPDNPHNVPTPDVLAAARTDKKNGRMDKALALIQCGDRPLSAIADEVGVSEKTITRYIDQFREQGHQVTVNGVCKVGA